MIFLAFRSAKCGSEHLVKSSSFVSYHFLKIPAALFAQFFVHFQQGKKSCDIVNDGEGILRKSAVNYLKSESYKFLANLEKLEGEFSGLDVEFYNEKKLKKLARMIYSEPIYEKIFLEHFADNN